MSDILRLQREKTTAHPLRIYRPFTSKWVITAAACVCMCVCYAHDPFSYDTFMAPDVCSAQGLSLSVPHLKLSFPLVCVCFFFFYLVARGGAKSTARPERLLSQLFSSTLTCAPSVPHSGAHRQDRCLKRADATVPASPQTTRVRTLTLSCYCSGRTTGKSLHGTFGSSTRV